MGTAEAKLVAAAVFVEDEDTDSDGIQHMGLRRSSPEPAAQQVGA
jgi:hypothetical protein